jgi:hypothetical protein
MHIMQELFGPLSMRALEDDRYVRQTEGYLPKANVAFVDEIFKANSAILNTLLTVLNERLFDNGTNREQVPLLCLVSPLLKVACHCLLSPALRQDRTSARVCVIQPLEL